MSSQRPLCSTQQFLGPQFNCRHSTRLSLRPGSPSRMPILHSGRCQLLLRSNACLPRRGGPGRRGRAGQNGLGKWLGRSPSAAGPPRPRPAPLGIITDHLSKKKCLLDTGSQVSLWPPSPISSKRVLLNVRLSAANGTRRLLRRRIRVMMLASEYGKDEGCKQVWQPYELLMIK